MKMKITSRTDKGLVRKHNEDDLLVRPCTKDNGPAESTDLLELGMDGVMLAVADGMGGHLAGEVASMLVIRAIDELMDMNLFHPGIPENEMRDLLVLVFRKAHTALIEREKSDQDTKGMGTTLVMGFIGNMSLHLAWLGDSRCYLYRRGSGLVCLTKDHTYVQMLVDAGVITLDEAFDHPGSNIITRSLMCEEADDPKPDQLILALKDSDRILLCSDGLNAMLRDHEIGEILATEADTHACADRLILAANTKGGSDNITVVLADLTDPG
jgi:protein phosphatase